MYLHYSTAHAYIYIYIHGIYVKYWGIVASHGAAGWLTLGNGLTNDNWDKEASNGADLWRGSTTVDGYDIQKTS